MLVVEDETLIALQTEQAVQSLGGEVLGPVATVAEALRLLATAAPDAAILDLNLAGQRSDDVARALAAAGVPFLLCSGYADDGDLSAILPGVRRLSKPVEPARLTEALADLVATGPRSPAEARAG